MLRCSWWRFREHARADRSDALGRRTVSAIILAAAASERLARGGEEILVARSPRPRKPNAYAAASARKPNVLILRIRVLRPMPRRRAARLWFQLQLLSTPAM